MPERCSTPELGSADAMPQQNAFKFTQMNGFPDSGLGVVCSSGIELRLLRHRLLQDLLPIVDLELVFDDASSIPASEIVYKPAMQGYQTACHSQKIDHQQPCRLPQ